MKMATMRALSLLTTSAVLLLLSSAVPGTDAARPELTKVNLFSELQKLTRWSQNFVADQISKGVRVLPGQNVDLRPLLEVYKRKMRSGWPSLAIPVLEPLRLPNVSLDTEADNVSLRGYLKDSQVSGISAVNARNLSLNLLDRNLSFGVIFPQLTTVGWYKVNGTLPTRLAVAGEGSYSVTAWNLVLAGSLRLKVTQRSVQVEDVHVRVSVDTLKMDLENFLGGGDVGRVMCETFSKAAPTILEEEREKVSQELSRQVEEFLNRKLASVEWTPGQNQCLLSVFKLPCLGLM